MKKLKRYGYDYIVVYIVQIILLLFSIGLLKTRHPRLIMAIAICAIAYCIVQIIFSKKRQEKYIANYYGALSSRIFSKSDALTMKVRSFVHGDKLDSIDKIYITVHNGTAADIETDDAYDLEMRISKKWYAVKLTPGAAPDFECLKLAPGETRDICVRTAGRYDALEHGYYRAVKEFCVKDERLTLAAEFML